MKDTNSKANSEVISDLNIRLYCDTAIALRSRYAWHVRFELLSVVRGRFPQISTVAMSGAYVGDEVPSGVIADCFFAKGSQS
jgi:hypothetical protein